MASHDPFGYLKHKLWPKKGPKVKLPIWILTTKSRGLPWFIWHRSFESCWQGLQLCFRPHLNWRSAQEIMIFQSRRSSNFGNFRTLNMGILGQNDIWLLARHRKYYKGEGGGFSKSEPWWVLWVCVCSWFVCAPKMFQLCTNQLVVWFVWVHASNIIDCHFS